MAGLSRGAHIASRAASAAARAAADPFVLDLDGDGVEFGQLSVAFDMDGDGYLEQTVWIASDDGILVLDEGLDGIIGSYSELAFTAGGPGTTDLDRLRGFDSNHDGVFSAADARFAEFKVWRDLNQNGISEAGELLTLSDLGITSIDLTGTPVDPSSGNVSYWADLSGNGLIDTGEVFTNPADAPAGAIAVQDVGDGLILNATGVTTQTGMITAYSVGLNFTPDGIITEIQGSDIVQTHEDGRIDRYYLVQTAAGQSVDLTGTGHAGAFGAEGNDALVTSGDKNVLFVGAAGDDTLTGGSGNDILVGGEGSDVLAGGQGDDTLIIDGDDLPGNISGGDGNDIVYVEIDDDVSLDLVQLAVEVAYGNAGNDTFTAAGGTVSVVLDGGAGNDNLTGGSDDDLLSGDGGADVLSGGDGDDILMIDAQDVAIDGGAGDDVVFVTSSDAVTLDLTAASIEFAFGHDGNDTFTATGPANVVMGGGGGNDTLTAGSGDDRLMGEAGNDLLSGGAGLDVAIFAGDADNYTVVATADGYAVTDNTGSDGTDQLAGIERLVFADETIHLDGTNNTPRAWGELWRFRDNGGATLLTQASLTDNDRDADSDLLKVTAVARAKGGDVSITRTGDVLFDASGLAGVRGSFDYQISDGHGGTAWATSQLEISAPLPVDELFQFQWALDALNVYDVWDDYTGTGIKVAIHDSGIDNTHADLAPNYNAALSQNYGSGGHGTMMAGLVAAARNGTGMVGVAYGSTLIGNDQPSLFEWYDSFTNVDIVSNSWTTRLDFRQRLQADAQSGRGGLGTITLFAAGNEAAQGIDVNHYLNQSSRHAITVGAIDADGTVATYSNRGTSLLVVAPGTAILSTDDQGADGYSNADGISGADYAIGSGTSASTPLVAGVVALMLDANPLLGWRDVQEILAYSAWNTDPTHAGWTTNGASNWNGGGLHVSRDYGFGLVDARAAVRLAETWTKTNTSANEVSAAYTTVVNQDIPDNTGSSVVSSIDVVDDIDIDHIEVTFDLNHTNVGDLIVELISPDGTRSVLINRPEVDPGSLTDRGSTADTLIKTYSSVQNWGELSQGTWTLIVRDAATGEIGHINSWFLKIYGDAASDDDVYVYTADFGSMISGADAARRILSDGAGHDAINASPIFQSAFLDLRAGHTSQLAGNSLTIAAETIIEDAYLGDGDDRVIGNEVANLISGGRGNDTLSGGAGADTLNGGQGADTASYAASGTAVAIDLSTGAASGGDALGDVLIGIENLEGSGFSDGLVGNDLDNALVGGTGHDTLAGGSGDDVLRGEAGDDVLFGGDGGDRLWGSTGNDQIDGGIGLDTACFTGLWSDYTITFDGTVTSVVGLDGTDILTGIEFLTFQDRTLYIGGSNTAPTAAPIARTFTQRLALTLTASELLQGTYDADGDQLGVLSIYASSHGLVTLTSSGDIRFTVDHDFVGTTTFDYTVSDGKGGIATATVSMRVDAVATFNGTSGNDVFLGLGTAETVYGHDGNDWLDGGYGIDSLFGGAGNDTLIGGPGADYLDGGDGVDALSYETAKAAVVVNLSTGANSAGDSFTGLENVVGSIYNDDLTGDASANTLEGGSGNDTLDGAEGADSLHGGDGGDSLRGSGGADTLAGGEGIDLLFGGSDGDSLLGGIGDDTLWGGAGGDTLSGGGGIDVASYRDVTSAVTIDLAAGTKSGNVDAIGDVYVSIEGLEGGTFGDKLTGDNAANLLVGNAGNDTLTGGLGNDTLAGGTGNDSLVGGLGLDTYLFNLGDGQDVVYDTGSDPGDVLQFGTGISAAQVIVSQAGSGQDLLLTIGTDKVTLDQTAYSSLYRIEELHFADGTVWSYDQMFTMATMATAGTDVFYGDDRANTLNGAAGTDSLYGGSGADTLIGGIGNDFLQGDSGSEIYVFNAGDGQDVISDYGFGSGDVDVLQLEAGISAANVVVSQAGSGHDLVLTIGTDSITLNEAIYNYHYWIEEVRFVDGTVWTHAQLFDMATMATMGNDVFYGDERANGLSGAAGNDSLYGGSSADTLSGGIGYDFLQGASGSDTYVFNAGDGQDVIADYGFGTGDVDVLQFGVGISASDVIVSQAGTGRDLVLTIGANKVTLDDAIYSNHYRIEEVRLADGTTWTYAQLLDMATTATTGSDVFYGDERANALNGGAGNDSLYGGSGSDTLAGGTGGDTLQGQSGNDLYLFNLGDGQEIINDNSFANDLDALLFGAGIEASQVAAAQAGTGHDLVLTIGTDRVTLDEAVYNSSSRIEEVRFADGTVWSYAQIFDMATIATAGNDTFYGDERANSLSGGSGNDTLSGASGNDTLIGGMGNDSLTGGLSSDIFVFAPSFGTDTITDFKAGAATDDVIEFSTSIFADYAAVRAACVQSGSNVVLTASPGNSITLKSVTLASLHMDDFRFV
jgi:Ca2+-binding RTX toxin-like protein